MLATPRWKKLVVLFVTLWAVVNALPNVVPALQQATYSYLPSKTINLGLDLQGGSYLLLEVDVNHYIREQLETLRDATRTALRDKNIGYGNLAVTPEEGVTVEARDSADVSAIAAELRVLDDRFITEQDGNNVHLRFDERGRKELVRQLIDQSIEIVRRRVDETGTREPIIQRQGDNRILLQVPGMKDPEHLKNLLGRTANLTFHMVDEVMPGAPVPTDSRRLPMDEEGHQGSVVVKRRAILSGDMLTKAAATFERGQPAVSFAFNTIGSRKFGEITQANVGKPFAIVLDNKVISAPVIREPILGGSGLISGSFSVQQASDLALLLRAGALPAPLKVVEERSIGPSLGADSVEAGKDASILGLLLVMGGMFLYYGRLGLFANAALVLNMVLLIAVLSQLGATLTLPGIAGIVLTMGMAVDGNVLIYERMFEEERNGRSVMAAVDAGFNRAYGTIMDSNITTLIAAALLYYFGAGPVKGFAVTLAVGICTSMFTAVMVTRMMIAWWVLRTRPKSL